MNIEILKYVIQSKLHNCWTENAPARESFFIQASQEFSLIT